MKTLGLGNLNSRCDHDVSLQSLPVSTIFSHSDAPGNKEACSQMLCYLTPKQTCDVGRADTCPLFVEKLGGMACSRLSLARKGKPSSCHHTSAFRFSMMPLEAVLEGHGYSISDTCRILATSLTVVCVACRTLAPFSCSPQQPI